MARRSAIIVTGKGLTRDRRRRVAPRRADVARKPQICRRVVGFAKPRAITAAKALLYVRIRRAIARAKPAGWP
jgi:hypothetical protein